MVQPWDHIFHLCNKMNSELFKPIDRQNHDDLYKQSHVVASYRPLLKDDCKNALLTLVWRRGHPLPTAVPRTRRIVAFLITRLWACSNLVRCWTASEMVREEERQPLSLCLLNKPPQLSSISVRNPCVTKKWQPGCKNVTMSSFWHTIMFRCVWWRDYMRDPIFRKRNSPRYTNSPPLSEYIVLIFLLKRFSTIALKSLKTGTICDLCSSGTNDNFLSVYKNREKGSFQPQQFSSYLFIPKLCYPADFILN